MTARIAPAPRPDAWPRLLDAAARHRVARQAGTFAAIGVVSTLAYVALYALLRAALPATVANALALMVTALGNTAANRRLTFEVRGRDGLARDHAAGLLAFGVALAITSVSLALLGRVAPGVARSVEVAVLVVASALATVARFALLRLAIDPVRRTRPAAAAAAPEAPAMLSPSTTLERIV